MARRLKNPMPDSLVAPQREAADPGLSAWVEANAGSGKTHVLTDRVIRLLLAGAQPANILCLTYTKAAAAEMRRRVAGRLAAWAVMPDAELDATLLALEQRPADARRRARARTLFAHALDTPGGLRIVTIHAFCEAILHRFPLEAGVPFDFTVVEDVEAQRMVLRAREAVLAKGVNGSDELSGPVESLFDHLSDFSIGTSVDEALGESRRLRRLFEDLPGARARLRDLVGDDGRSSDEVRSAIVGERLIDAEAIADVLAEGAGGKAFVTRLATLDPRHPAPSDWMSLFLIDKGTVRDALVKAASRVNSTALALLVYDEARRLEALLADLRRAELVERSEALLDVLAATWARYEDDKRARSLLDFDDLVERVGRLFADIGVGPWVRYKLDAGITHVLIDESQDTNAEQWTTIDAIAGEFFEPGGPELGPRTLFAVGDQKQSIYSFQGAEPQLFLDRGRLYELKAARAETRFRRIPLHTSFRTLPGVLAAVDRVFETPGLAGSVLATEPVHHDTARDEGGGTVTLWPIEQDGKPDPSDAWPIDLADGGKSAARRVAERIAGAIGDWVRNGRPLGRRNRPVRYDDILVLVQSRNAIFGELIRALHRNGIPTPGADRLTVTTHIAVLDLIALGDALSNTADDLQLATVLRSPLFDLGEDDLYALAQPREKYQSLWQAMKVSPLPAVRNAWWQLHGWRKRLHAARPYTFFADVLYAGGGLRRFHARMGREVDDVFAEFLELALQHEQSPQPSLLGFLAALREARDISIKRELSEAGTGVRVMTVHGAKGLEAPVVILADAASKPVPRRAVFIHDTPAGPVLIHSSGSAQDVPATEAIRDGMKTAEADEYWRRLYVAMTRAEDELYVTGALTQRAKVDGTWYATIETALAPHATALDESLVFPAPEEEATLKPQTAGDALRTPLVLSPLPAPQVRRTVRPSLAAEHADPVRALETPLEAYVDAETARREGIALHALLQHLVPLPHGQRGAVAERAVAMLMPEAEPKRARQLVARALSILSRLELLHLFGSESRAEVPFLVHGRRDGEPIRLAGRMDRLVVDDHGVLVVDYKSDASPPRTAAQAPGAYVTQLGLYALVAGQLFPGKQVSAGILWTALESLMILPSSQLSAAVAGFTLE